MKNKMYLMIVFLCWSSANAQDTIIKNYPNTKQRWEIVYDQGQKTKETIYYASGSSWMSAQYDAKNREYWIWYHENGNPFFKATIVNDKIEGLYQIWYENGQLAEQLIYRSNLENGKAEFYHPNGRLAMGGIYEDGKMIGDWQFRDEQGSPANGLWKWYFAALPDQIRMQGRLENGRRIGKWMYQTTSSGPDKKTFTEIFK